MIRPSALLCILATAVPAAAASGPADEFFENRVRPLLAEKCYACHSDKEGMSKGGLRLDSRKGVFDGGDAGPAVAAGKPADSLLMKAVRRNGDETSAMPPDEALSDAQIKVLEKWIADGAAFPEAEQAGGDPFDHWAFRKLERPT
ncbi:MAG: c-type cytochrome domain-containing protein, partial [Planctomycetia bacterium]